VTRETKRRRDEERETQRREVAGGGRLKNGDHDDRTAEGRSSTSPGPSVAKPRSSPLFIPRLGPLMCARKPQWSRDVELKRRDVGLRGESGVLEICEFSREPGKPVEEILGTELTADGCAFVGPVASSRLGWEIGSDDWTSGIFVGTLFLFVFALGLHVRPSA
jgi:hypothetical protein